jgi:hypothetical protein
LPHPQTLKVSLLPNSFRPICLAVAQPHLPFILFSPVSKAAFAFIELTELPFILFSSVSKASFAFIELT